MFSSEISALYVCGRGPKWRRITPGTNNISAFGVWATGSRRQSMRFANLCGTRWHQRPTHEARRAAATHLISQEGA